MDKQEAMARQNTEAVIEIPFLPDRELSLNARAHWTKRHEASQVLKKAAWAIAKSNETPRFRKATVYITYVVKTQRVRDPDNGLALAKSAIDGLVAAGVFPDDNAGVLRYAPVLFRVDRAEAPKTIIRIVGLEEEVVNDRGN